MTSFPVCRISLAHSDSLAHLQTHSVHISTKEGTVGQSRLVHFSVQDGDLTARYGALMPATIYFKRVVSFIARTNTACRHLPNAEFVVGHDDHPKVHEFASIDARVCASTKEHLNLSPSTPHEGRFLTRTFLRSSHRSSTDFMLKFLSPTCSVLVPFWYQHQKDLTTKTTLYSSNRYTYKSASDSGWNTVTWGKPLRDQLSRCPPYDKRNNTVFFRGSCSGPVYGYAPSLWRFYHRQRFSRLVRQHPELLSGGMTELCKGLEQQPFKAQVENETAKIGHTPQGQYCEYRHLLQLDGNTASGR